MYVFDCTILFLVFTFVPLNLQAPLPASKKLKLGIKYKMPMPNVFSLIAKDVQSGMTSVEDVQSLV